ncbi:hypothetical protein GQ44DRAFT_632845 [Phaeosphaeriaceae sp. PMI808]|nr:hypothetical protein GQ44DRAFT_632845 [Phaeosphaeriaceae sp. PMI808]
MASEIPEYFLPRNWDYPPNGPIKLGNVLTSLKEPHRPLATIKPDPAKIINLPKELVEIETGKSKSGGFSILTTFLSGLLGLGVDTGVDVEKRFVQFSAQSMSRNAEQAEYNKYIDRCAKAPAVRRYLERKRFRKHVYVITGIKTVNGAKFVTKSSSSTEAMVGVQVDGTILSGGVVPVGGGPEIRGGRGKKFNISWQGSSEFVLAFKVSKVRVDKAGNVVSEDEYLKGAFLEHTPQKEISADTSVEVVQQPGVEEGFSATTVREGDDLVAFGVPEDDDENDDNEEEKPHQQD